MKKRLTTFAFLLFTISSLAQPGGIQSGAAALDGLTNDMEAYMDPITTVVYVVAALIGLVGALRVYIAWQQGKDNVMSSATGWFGACLFILIANTVLRAMFVN
jgi:Domain of unknown function (DUF4134)